MNLQDLINEGEEGLQRLVDEETQESLTLDFKNGLMFADGTLTSDGRSALGPALSSFANSAGGLLIIGMDCRPVAKVDRATKLTPVLSLDRALTSLMQAVGDILQPRHDGIEVQSIMCQSVHNAGYLAISVPRSERRPHMSQPDKHYYKRAGASNFKMEHYDIEDAFKRSSGPDLRLEHSVRKGLRYTGITSVSNEVRIHLAIANEGAGTAKHVNLRFHHPSKAIPALSSRFSVSEGPKTVSNFRDTTIIGGAGRLRHSSRRNSATSIAIYFVGYQRGRV